MQAAGGHDERTTRHRQDGPRHVLAEVREVAGKQRSRLALVVTCAGCNRRHLHYAPLGSVGAMLRKPPCGRAAYYVHAAVELLEVAS